MSAICRIVSFASIVGLVFSCGCARIECETNVDCNDGNACTSDICVDRTCENLPLCTSDSQCDDGNQCTNDVCQIGCCVNTPPACAIDSECDDDDANTIDVCVDGCCANTGCIVDSDCDDGDACTSDSCDTDAGRCVTSTVTCLGEEACDPEVGCVFCPFTDCDDGVACTDDSCDETMDKCINTINNKNCSDDGSFCNGVELCDPTDGCMSSGFPCAVDELCDEANGVCVGPRGELHDVVSQVSPILDPVVNGCENATPVELELTLSGALSGSVVSKVKVSYEIQHACSADVMVELWTLTDAGLRESLTLRTACETAGCEVCQEELLSETVDEIHQFDQFAISPNRAWHLEVRDCWNKDEGELRSFEIWVEYAP